MKGLGEYMDKLKEMINDWKLILNLASKPSPEEFNAILKVVGLATVIIGIIAYVIRVIVVLTLYG